METKENEDTFHAIVRGRVQGVGFRFFVYRCASSLKLNGAVRNLPDGSVEVRARGNRSSLKNLEEQLKKGPMLARVSNVETKWGLALEPIEGFQVID